MSHANRRRSKPIDALIASIRASGPAANRPPHRAFTSLFLSDSDITRIQAE